MDLASLIRTIPDHPKPGIMFRDVTTLFSDAEGFARTIDALSAPFAGASVAKVAGIEARGFILGGAVARALGAGFVPLRKKGKLPYKTVSADYVLEYGMDTIEMHIDACQDGEKVLLIDDLIATGGTALAGLQLLRRAGADVLGAAFVVDLPELGGAERLRQLGLQVTSLMAFQGH